MSVFRREVAPLFWSVGPLVCPPITSKTDYVAIPSRLGFGDPLVLFDAKESSQAQMNNIRVFLRRW
jgi:hypothetical protein